MIGIVDYGMGNLQSVQNALKLMGAETRLVKTAEEIAEAEKLVLPGVGAFGDAMAHLDEHGMRDALKAYAESGRPFLGICLGMQLLFDSSEEAPGIAGLGILKGTVRRFSADMGLKIPHMGWNTLDVRNGDGILRGLDGEAFVYFVHSYYVDPADAGVAVATTPYGIDFVSVVERSNVAGAQFHPEKSQKIGLQILSNFISN